MAQETQQKKLDKLYQGPYKVERNRSTEQSLYIRKGGDVVKVSIRNVKAYVGPMNFDDAIEDTSENKARHYNLRQRKPGKYTEASSSDGD